MKTFVIAFLFLTAIPAFATPARYAIVNQATGTVMNVAWIDSGDGSTVAPGTLQILSSTANIGDHWDGTQFTPPLPL